MDQSLLKILACPRDHNGLHFDGSRLACPNNHQYLVVDGTPIMLLNDVDQTLWVAKASLDKAVGEHNSEQQTTDLYVESLGISQEAREALLGEVSDQASID